MYLALKVSDLDNVATVFAEGIQAGAEIEVRDKKGESVVIRALDPIPYGHKVAVREIETGEQIMKYGEEIGRVKADTPRGTWIHTHNMSCERGRR